MSHFYRFILSAIVAIACFFCLPATSQAQSFTVPVTPLTAQDLSKRGVDQMLHGNYQEAIKDFTQAINLKANFAAAYSDRCLAYTQLKNYQPAIKDCTQAASLAANNPEAYFNRGLAHYRIGNYQAAIADNNRVINLKPSNFRAYYNRGVARSSLGKYSEAINDYNQALSQIPQSKILIADIYNDRGLARLQLKDLKGATLDFSLAIQLNANDRAYYNRGCACQRHGDNFSAVRDFTQSLRLNPANTEAYVNRGIAHHQLGYQQAAIADLEKAAQGFISRGEKLPYQKTLNLINKLQQWLSDSEIIV